MAGSVTSDRLRELAAFRVELGCAISLYLGFDPSTAATIPAAQAKINSLLDEAQKSAFANRGELTHDQRGGLQADFDRIRKFLTEDFDRSGVHGVAIFAAGLDHFWNVNLLSQPVLDDVRVGPDFYVAPLVPLLGRGNGAIVAVVDRERGLLFVLQDGRLEPLADLSEEQPGKHDQGGRSQARYQRHIEELVRDHLRTVADDLDKQLRSGIARHVVVVGPDEARSDFEGLLSHEAKAAVVGMTSGEGYATPNELLELAVPFIEHARVAEETAILERWQEEAGRNGRAAAGWEQTLESASDGRVEVLLFQEGVRREAYQCPQCGRAQSVDGACPLDGTHMVQRDDGVDLAVRRTLAHGGDVHSLARERRARPKEDLISAMTAVVDEGDRLTEDELVGTCALLLNAGHEATVNVTGNGWWALFRHPLELGRLRKEPTLVSSAIEELMRWDTPLQLFERWVLEDIEVRGARIGKGAELGLLFGSANRDPAVFAKPDGFDLGREPNPHLTFGAGIHFCLGAALARLELETSFATVLRRLPNMELVETPTWKPNYIIRGLRELRVRG